MSGILDARPVALLVAAPGWTESAWHLMGDSNMRLIRYFFISDNLDELEDFERDLKKAGFVTPQVHLLTNHQASASEHTDLHQVTSLMRRDVVHSTLVGAAFGVFALILALAIPYFSGATDTAFGWTPFVFLAVILLGFCAWQGGLWGIQKPNSFVRRFERTLAQNRHVFFVDVNAGKKRTLQAIAKKYPTLGAAGSSRGAPKWIVYSQHRIKWFFSEIFP